MHIRFLAGTLLCAACLFADEEEDSVTDQMQSSLYQTMDFSDVKITSGKTSQTLETKKGNADISVTVDNVDPMSRLKYDWEKANPKEKKNEDSKETKRSKKKGGKEEKKRTSYERDEGKDEEERDSHSPSVRTSISWKSK